MSRENVEIVRAAIAALQRGDLAAMFATGDDEIEWVAPPEDPDQGTVVGPAAARDAFDTWMGTWDEYRYELDELLDAGDDVLVSGRQAVVVRGAEVASTIFWVVTVHDGRAVRVCMFYDRKQALEAAGMPE